VIVPKILKDFVKACAHERMKNILSKLGGPIFAELVGESLDKTIKEENGRDFEVCRFFVTNISDLSCY
jgi:hypothetical protein